MTGRVWQQDRTPFGTMTAWVLALLVSNGCSSLGPSTVNRDRFDYITAISESWKKQTLLNIIKMRYADAPVFLEVGQVISFMFETTYSVPLQTS